MHGGRGDDGRVRTVSRRFAVVGFLLLAAACSGPVTAPPPPAPLPPSAPEPIPPPPLSPFTGLPTDLAAPVLAVKIDNDDRARPQTGLTQADLVYVEPVEGGISRLLAVYQSQVPPRVGPVRSVRETDLQLLANFGAPALAFSGEAPELRDLVRASPVVDVSATERPWAYSRDRDRRIPHNLYADTAPLLPGAAPPRDIGFRFGPVPSGGRPLPGISVQYALTDIVVEWVPAESRWVFVFDGAPLTAAEGGRPGAATVVLQRVVLRETAIRDASDTPSPFAETIGQGEALLLRDGLAFDARWSRPTPPDPTTFTGPGGEPLTFAPGPVWVLFVPA